MTVTALPNAPIMATADGFTSGLVGTIGVRILAADGSVVLARATAGITEPAPGFYQVQLAAPAVPGVYSLYWDNGSSGTALLEAAEDLVVTTSTAAAGLVSTAEATVSVFVGSTMPALVKTLGVDLDAEGFDAAAFSMRPSGSAAPKVDHAAATIITPATGVVQYAWQAADVNTAGDYLAWWTLSGPGGALDTGEFLVRVEEHAPGVAVVTPIELAQTLRLLSRGRKLSADDHELLEQLITRATVRVENHIGHRFAQETATTKVFSTFAHGLLDLKPWDLRGQPTLVAIDTDLPGGGAAVAPVAYRLEPRTAPHGFYTHILVAYGDARRWRNDFWSDEATPVAQLGRQVSITGDWGWAEVPEDLKGAIIEVAAASWSAPRGDQRTATPTWTDWPSSVTSILEHYRRPRL